MSDIWLRIHTAKIKQDPSVLLRGPKKENPPFRAPDTGNRR
jgi:hypothetical protein